MAALNRIDVVWSGLTGLPGISTFYFDPAETTAPADVVAFFTAVAALFPPGLTWAVPSSGDVINDATGQLTGGWTQSGGATVASTGSGSYAAGVGGYINWGTNDVIDGRRVRGRTFLVPIRVDQYDANGTLVAGFVTAVNSAATTLVAATSLQIWRRPTVALPSGGFSAPITSFLVPDQVTSLRTRRR